MQKRSIILLLIFLLITPLLWAQQIILVQRGMPTSIRGLCVVDDSVAWVSGSNGYVALTADGGRTWAWQQVKGFEQVDFRSIVAFSIKEAVIMSSGTPALILKTTNGGVNWQEKYRNTDTACFLDAMGFYNSQNGFVLGDPVNHKFMLLTTSNGGNTWNDANGPVALPGEAAFAASGTCLRAISGGKMLIATGGAFAEVDISQSKNGWRHHLVPLLKERVSTGAFSIATGAGRLVVVGGDYQNDKRSDSTACYSTDNGKTWRPAAKPPSGYLSCVEYINGDTFLSTGTAGTNISTDGGKTWLKIDTAGFNVCRKAMHGKLVLLAGNNGRMAVLTP